MTRIATVLIVLVTAACSSPLRADPPADRKWAPIPELTDEFEGVTLDEAKWYDHNPGWKGRKPGFFSPKNVSVHDGQLHLTARMEDLEGVPEGFHTFTTAAVKGKALVKYGYFEIRCRPMKSGASSAFWFYHSTPEEWTEIDVFEICGVGEKWKNAYHMNLHVFRTPTEKKHWSRGGKWIAPYNLADEYHVYALDWSKEAIKWLVDGKVVREEKNTHWRQPLQLNFDSETMPEWFGLPDKKDLPSTFSIDYVRSWKKAGVAAQSLQANRTAQRSQGRSRQIEQQQLGLAGVLHPGSDRADREPEDVVRSFIAAMNHWENESARISDAWEITPKRFNLEAQELIFDEFCTPKERKRGRLSSFQQPPEYDPELEDVVKVRPITRSRVEVDTVRHELNVKTNCTYVLLKKGGAWLIDSLKRKGENWIL